MGESEGRGRRIGGARIGILAISMLALGGIVGGQGSEALAGKIKPSPTIRSPRDGQRLPASPALVKLYLGSARLVGAKLNGRHIENALGRGRRVAPCVGTPLPLTRGATCKLRASPSYGLRHGRNALKARFKRHHSVRVRRVHFHVARHRPLAAAGRDQHRVPGSRVRLNGRASLVPPRLRLPLARAGKHVGLRYRWRLVHTPHGGHGRMTGAHTPTPRLRLDPTAVGKYRIRLTVTADNGRSGSDSVVVWSANQGAQGPDAAPLVGVDTMATVDKQPGVRLDVLSGAAGPPGCPKPLGLSCFYPDPGQGRQWVQLVVLDRRTLSLVANKSFSCGQATQTPKEGDFLRSSGALDCILNLANYIKSLDDSNLVIAVNQPGDGTNTQEQPPVGVGATLSGGVKFGDREINLGIDANAWFNAVRNGKDLPAAVRGTFSAVGVPGWKTGGTWNLAQDPGTWLPAGAGRLHTNIAVNNLARYAPLDPVAADKVDSPLVKVLTQNPQPWPTATDQQARALSAISDKVGMTSDPRSFYYSAPPTEDWAADLAAIDRLQYKDFGMSPGFAQEDFNWAQDRLNEEVFWITKVNTYVNALAMPYDGASKTLWSDFQKDVSDIVNTETSNGTGAKVWAGTKAVLEGLVDLIPGAGSAFKWSEGAVFAAEAIIATYHAGVDIAEVAGEPADSGFQADVAELGKKLGDRLDEAETEIRVRFRNIIVADYGKLKTVALCSTSSAGCDAPQDGWRVTNNSVTNMQTVLKMGLQREIFTELVPAKFPLALGLTPVTQSYVGSGLDASDWCQPIPPFEHTTGVYQWGYVDWNYWNGVTPSERPTHAATITPFVLTAGDPGLFQTWHAASWTVFGRMFDPIDPSGDFNKGGLAIDEAKFMTDSYKITPGQGRTEHFEYAPDASFPSGCHWKGT